MPRRPDRGEPLRHLPDAAASSRPSTRHRRNSRRAARLVRLVRLHRVAHRLRRQLPGGLFREPAMIVGVRTLPVTDAVVWTTSRPTSRLSSASMRRDRARRPRARATRICSAAAIAFCVSSACTRAAAARASSISCLPSAPAFARTSWRSTSIRASSALIFSALARPLGDLLPPRLEHLQDRLVGEHVQHGADDAEADDLRAAGAASRRRTSGRSRSIWPPPSAAACSARASMIVTRRPRSGDAAALYCTRNSA